MPETTAPGRGTPGGLTVADHLRWLADGDITEGVLDWAPDVAALSGALLQRSHAFRFVVSPPAGAAWPPHTEPPYRQVVDDAAAAWRSMMDRGVAGAPEVVRRLLATVQEHSDATISDVAEGRPWELCEALLMLHAIADEAAAGCGGNPVDVPGGAVHLARARELLTRRGTMSRLPADRLVHLPKTRTTAVGMTHRSLSRYSCTTTDGIPAVWHRAPLRRAGTQPTIPNANVLLLPWPMRIRETDFVPVPGSVRRPEREPFGFFRYEPSEPLDLELVDALLDAALDEVESVDVVAMPEGCLQPDDVAAVESLLARRGVSMLVAGLRIEAEEGQLPGNGVHIGVLLGDQWWHYRQNKHHRWFLDGGQVEQYNIAGALHPSVRWWEEMQVPRRSVNVFELGNGITMAAVVCEDLARIDGVAELLRSVGPTLVVTLLLDGPQLASRWTSRYAGVLADDPGSAVLTLTAYGMTQRSRPRGMPPSGVVAMWKDPLRGLREIPLESGAQGVLLKAVQGTSPRYAADGRAPADDATDLYVAGVQQLRAAPGSGRTSEAGDTATPPTQEELLDAPELSILYSWAEAAAHVLAGTPPSRLVGDGEAGATSLDDALAHAEGRTGWRETLGLPEPSERLQTALETLGRLSRATHDASQGTSTTELLSALREVSTDGDRLAGLVRRTLVMALEAVRPRS